eukprot:Mycagemm_TRINITY_DN9460_c0_g2::TRINITY_DN9460_c0_g2_i2::g.2999::m.2999 type:complete len:106 gc:universal TRINITY_DN9460_c0_g2_i2:454-137(-)
MRSSTRSEWLTIPSPGVLFMCFCTASRVRSTRVFWAQQQGATTSFSRQSNRANSHLSRRMKLLPSYRTFLSLPSLPFLRSGWRCLLLSCTAHSSATALHGRTCLV